MEEPIIGTEKLRCDLKSKRELIFAEFSEHPSNIDLALEIKLLDDRISDLSIALSKQRNRKVAL